ncbi:MAG: electron transfer flavoprotein subunit alpha [Firmicutes bacterium]|nr:electron transfer flavoprotein subunit alpha [Candidatus Fermentithermobacillaceae bacterium]
MAYIEVNQEKVTQENAERLASVCPFGAIVVGEAGLTIESGCRLCGLCLKADKDGVLTLVEDKPSVTVDKSAWQGIAVLAECDGDQVYPITLELLGKALEMAAPSGAPVFAVVTGWKVSSAVENLRYYGADRIYVYDDSLLEHFEPLRYTVCVTDLIQKVRPSVVMAGATSMGRSLAPRIAARFGTGITADCTGLAIRENGDLVQTRPAFGGNIMAQIVTPHTRPQLCTVRYRVFDAAPRREKPTAQVEVMQAPDGLENLGAQVLDVLAKPKELDISEAEVIVAVGRGVKDEAGLSLAKRLADILGAQLACTRPMVENGWFDPRRQIGLSGRTVKPKLIITIGVSGAVQFAAGMDKSEFIISINNDPEASIFNLSHIGLVGDLYEVLPAFMEKVEREGLIL